MIARVLLSLIAASVLGCSTLSKTECRQMDWHEKGRVDALTGKEDSIVEFEKYRKTCQLHQVEVDSNSYQAGFLEGRELFCQPENGYHWAKSGKLLPQFCPGSELYLNSFSKGRYEYLKGHCSSLSSEVASLDGQLAWARSQQTAAQTNYSTMMTTVPPDDPSRFSRESMAQSEISSYDSKADSLEMALNQKRAELWTCESELLKQKEKVQ